MHSLRDRAFRSASFHPRLLLLPLLHRLRDLPDEAAAKAPAAILGAADVDLSILSVRTELERPQLKVGALTEFSDFWDELFQMQETGVFGLRGAIRNEFGFTPDYPLATLPIDKEFLDEKWVLTHPAFADDEEGW